VADLRAARPPPRPGNRHEPLAPALPRRGGPGVPGRRRVRKDLVSRWRGGPQGQGGWRAATPRLSFDLGGIPSMEIRDLVLVDGVRTPMAEYNGSFADLSAIDLGAHAARSLLDRLGVEGSEIDHAVVGNALQTSPDAIYGARHVALKAGLPRE